MALAPRISVITPSLNQGRFIAETIESVRSQGYPDFEHIVMDGMSSDETPAILARYPHLRVIREPDRGQADAINKGFRLATGSILCFLNSDDTFLPGALQRVAGELDAARDRHVVVGRCIYVAENGVPLGQEHCWLPALSRRRVLAAWKGNCIPQPATFWTAEAWRKCGPLDDAEHLVFDYDFMCRLSGRFRLHALDHVLATYRLHPESKSCFGRNREAEARSLRVSRKYWGPRSRWQYWRLNLASTSAARLSGARVIAKRYLRKLNLFNYHSPLTLMWRDFRGVHADGVVGPIFVTSIHVEPEHRKLVLMCRAVVGDRVPSLDIQVFIDGRAAAVRSQANHRQLLVTANLKDLPRGDHQLEVRCRQVVIPHELLGNGDFRPLAFRLDGVVLANEEEVQ